jgi:hypothetical protein
MVVSFGCDTEETERRLLIFPKAGGFDGSRDHDGVAPRDVCSRTRGGALPPCRSEKTAVPIDSACGTTARRALEWLNVGAALIDDSRRLTAFARPPSVSLRAGAPAAGSVLGPAAFF